MRELLATVDFTDLVASGLTADLTELITRGWREGRGGALLLAASDELAAGHSNLALAEVGSYEYEQNDFAITDEDLVQAVPQFAPRLALGAPLLDDGEVDYRGPDGALLTEVRGYVQQLAQRSVAFAAQVLTQARRQELLDGHALTAVVSSCCTGDLLVNGATVRFTTGRGRSSSYFDMSWFDDLETFKLAAMAVLTWATPHLPSPGSAYGWPWLGPPGRSRHLQ